VSGNLDKGYGVKDVHVGGIVYVIKLSLRDVQAAWSIRLITQTQLADHHNAGRCWSRATRSTRPTLELGCRKHLHVQARHDVASYFDRHSFRRTPQRRGPTSADECESRAMFARALLPLSTTRRRATTRHLVDDDAPASQQARSTVGGQLALRDGTRVKR